MKLFIKNCVWIKTNGSCRKGSWEYIGVTYEEEVKSGDK